MANQIVTLAARKTGESWEAALVLDNKFIRAFMGTPGEPLSAVVGVALLAYMGVRNTGTEITVTLNISEPDAS